MKTNRIVGKRLLVSLFVNFLTKWSVDSRLTLLAMNQTWMEADKSAWCGKEVKVFKEDGIELVYDEPLVLWDTCGECAVHVKIDFGGE